MNEEKETVEVPDVNPKEMGPRIGPPEDIDMKASLEE